MAGRWSQVGVGVHEDEGARGEAKSGDKVGGYGKRTSVDTDVGILGAGRVIREWDFSLGSSGHEEKERDALA